VNSVLLQSVSEIQKHLQQCPSNVKLQQSERFKTPSDAQKHGMDHNDGGKSSYNRNHQGTKRGGSSGVISTESSIQKTNSARQSSSGMEYNISKMRKRNKSHSFLTEEFKKDKERNSKHCYLD
jgi:hypothetical protein